MGSLGMSVAKLKAVGKALASVIEEGPKPPRREIQNFPARDVRSYFHAAQNELHELRSLLPEMFGDFPDIGIEPEIEMASEPGKARPPNQYSRNQVLQLSREVRHMLDLATEGAPRGMHSILNAPRRVFISHGRAADWRVRKRGRGQLNSAVITWIVSACPTRRSGFDDVLGEADACSDSSSSRRSGCRLVPGGTWVRHRRGAGAGATAEFLRQRRRHGIRRRRCRRSGYGRCQRASPAALPRQRLPRSHHRTRRLQVRAGKRTRPHAGFGGRIIGMECRGKTYRGDQW